MSPDSIRGLMILLGLAGLIVSLGAHSEARKEFEKRKAAGEAVGSEDGMSSLQLTWKFLPRHMRAPYHWFMGCCFVVIFVLALLADRASY